jgi:hypothetical protein
MSEESKENLKNLFAFGQKLSEPTMHSLIDSLVHKSEDINIIKEAVGIQPNQNLSMVADLVVSSSNINWDSDVSVNIPIPNPMLIETIF